MPIVVLSSQVVNKIAAGEVIDCPASVVKELVENSIDAGAKSINISVDDKGGRSLISVSDDGCGIPHDDMEKAFICHATSKLADGDISNVKYMGFRGEGLTSIAAVARVRMVSKHCDEEKAWSIAIEGGEKIGDLTPESLTCGTEVEVRDLFFATPTRLKFLRTEKVEIQNIVDLLTKLVIANYSIAFSLTIGDKQIFKYKARDEMSERIRDIKLFGDTFLEQSLEVSHTVDYLKVYGLVGFPTYNKSRPGSIYTFVNSRPIHSALLMSAVKGAYSGLIPKDRHPVAILSIEVSPGNVDVNVHPSKLEVRFQDTRFVYSTVLNVVKEAMARSEYTKLPSLESSTAHEYDHFVMDSVFKGYGKNSAPAEGEYKDSRESSPFEPLFESSFHSTVESESSHKPEGKKYVDDGQLFCEIAPTQKDVHKKKCTEHHHDDLWGEQPLGNAIGQLFERYIIAQTKDHTIIVDQHAAHERLVCEYMKKVIENEGVKRQVLMMPELIELDSEYEFELLNEYRGKLLDLGLLIEPIGGLTMVVREVPAIFGVFDVKMLISKIIENIMKVGDEISMEERIQHICGTVACYGSIRSGRVMKMEEMNSLLRSMESTPHSGQCNHGRPTYVKLSLSEIDRMFERT